MFGAGSPVLSFDGWAAVQATAAADWLSARAIREGNRATWIGLTVAKDGHWTLAPVGLDLYEGLPGIALFLAYAGKILQRDDYTELAHAAVEQVAARIRDTDLAKHSIGAFSGLGGVAYCYQHLGSLWSEESWLRCAEALFDSMTDMVSGDCVLDVFAGSAGAICSASAAWGPQRAGSKSAERLVRTAAERIVALSEEREDGSIAWPSPVATQPLTGLAHGAAGIGLGLWLAYRISGESRFRQAAERSWRYEATVFSSAEENWPDFRKVAQSPFMTAWCHGAVGIGCARLITRRLLKIHTNDAEILSAVSATERAGTVSNQCLCHGDLGNLVFLRDAFTDLQAGSTLGERISAFRLQLDATGGLCGAATTGLTNVAGLMMGVAGIGMGLLNLSRPSMVPNVMLLESPNVRDL